MEQKFAAELRNQIPQDKKDEIIGQVRAILALGASPLALQIAVQLKNCSVIADVALNLV